MIRRIEYFSEGYRNNHEFYNNDGCYWVWLAGGEFDKYWEEPLSIEVIKRSIWNPSKRIYEDKYMLQGTFRVNGLKRIFVKTKKLIFTWRDSEAYFSSRPNSYMNYLANTKEELVKTYKNWHEDSFERSDIYNRELLDQNAIDMIASMPIPVPIVKTNCKGLVIN